MPKLKTHRGASKRFKKTASGKYKHRRANRGHILTKKSPKRLRGLRGTGIVCKRDQLSVARMLCDE